MNNMNDTVHEMTGKGQNVIAIAIVIATAMLSVTWVIVSVGSDKAVVERLSSPQTREVVLIDAGHILPADIEKEMLQIVVDAGVSVVNSCVP